MKHFSIIRDNPLDRRSSAFCFFALLLACQPLVAQEAAPDSGDVLAAAAKRSPAVAAVLDMPRDKPADALSAVATLVNLGEFEAAGEVFKPLADSELSAADRATVAQQLGTARLVSLAAAARKNSLAGVGDFAQSCLAAAADEAAKPERLAKLIADLQSKSPETRQAARNDLASTGLPAAKGCIQTLAGATDKEQRAQLLLALADMRPLVDPLVLAALADGEGQFRRDMVELAGHLHLVNAVPWLAVFAAGGDAEAEVVTSAQTALQQMGLSQSDPMQAVAVVKREMQLLDAGSSAEELGPWWSFDPAAKTITSQELPASVRKVLAEARLSQVLLALPTTSPADRQLAIVSAWEAAARLGKAPNKKISYLVESFSVAELGNTLSLALDKNAAGAAVTCADLLGQRADLEALQSLDGKPAPLVQAASSANIDVRFAALQAIMRIHPQQSYLGSSQVLAAMWSVAAGAGTPQAVVGGSTVAHADEWAGMLRAEGFDALPAVTGIEMIRSASAARRVGLLLIDAEITRPAVREVLYQLRSQPHLAHVPVAVLCGGGDMTLGEKLAEVDEHLLAVPRPRSREAMKSLVARLNQLQETQTSDKKRTQRAAQAIEWLGTILAEGGPYDELQRDAALLEQTVYQSELQQASITALSAVGTSGSQIILLNLASQDSLPIEVRRAAATAFGKSFAKFGCLLTAEQIAQQYDRYNASETADAETQKLLGEILDTIERKSEPEKK